MGWNRRGPKVWPSVRRGQSLEARPAVQPSVMRARRHGSRGKYALFVPVISTFFGIVIRMYYQDHEPGHFHAEYQGQAAVFDFSGAMLRGSIRSGTALRLVRDWTAQHRTELEANWARMKAGRALDRIAPLE